MFAIRTYSLGFTLTDLNLDSAPNISSWVPRTTWERIIWVGILENERVRGHCNLLPENLLTSIHQVNNMTTVVYWHMHFMWPHNAPKEWCRSPLAYIEANYKQVLL